jgi:ATP-binding cassette subfamily B protein
MVAALSGRIEFEHVWFEYIPGNPVLKDVNLVIEPGQKVAILGATGAGKTTLLALLCRFYDPTRGRILLDGHDLRDLDLEDLRRNIGLVFQESFLFSNTVAANIAFGHPEATVAQVEAAARIAAAHDFVTALPHGYDTVLGEGGVDLSGGQRQRLAIARAVLLDPAILLLDDPAAAIDPHTEHEILAAMERAMQGRTTLVIAHRLSTLRQCDRVIVLDNGQIAQRGTHAELMEAEGHYRHAAQSQLAGARA